MPLTDQTRIARQAAQPQILRLWRALVPLTSTVSFMNTGAHPDDETSAMLAAMGFRDGVDLSYACSTRGEGGQNDIGTEATEALGVLRTAEMERASDALNLRMYWLSQFPDDTIFDFGFSKSGKETLAKWDEARTLARFVDILRLERPDIICPTFLDIPGQHGHHRAMTEAAHRVFDLAADPTYGGSTLPVWQVKKLYLPAWSGAGQAYDDDLPPPPATLTVSADGIEEITGTSYAMLGQHSRAFHKTQAMGNWVAPGAERNWPLHLANRRTTGPDTTIADGLPQTLADLGNAAAQMHIDAALAAFPDRRAVVAELSAAHGALDLAACPPDLHHKLRRKQQQLATALRIAAGVELRATLDRDTLRPGDSTGFQVEQRTGDADQLRHAPALPDGWLHADDTLSVTPDAPLADPYPDSYLPGAPRAPCVEVAITTAGVTSTTYVPFETPPLVLPATSARLTPMLDVVNRRAPARDIDLHLRDIHPTGATPTLDLPAGWSATQNDTGLSVTLPADVAAGRYDLPLRLNGDLGQTQRQIAHDHIDPRALITPAQMQLSVIDAALPEARIGYIGGGNDRVDHWLDRMGADVTALSDDQIASDSALAGFDTLVIGIFAMRFRPALAPAMPRLHDWVKNGGTLVTLYHRPWDNWHPDTTPPAPLEIGQPSLRWRVTNENAKVTPLADHPLLSHPNQITEADWAGWHKERGLYFAKRWDTAYTPLLEMADPDEDPHHGALLVADIGKGRHVHCALILHHQMEKGVPGAFRLMANLCAPRG
ncbi:PIG-L family deacetylase [Phaeobacter sp. J2-8]|uniref:PIG-L family deacetylase n=1 Tax=Phaeobacter sp. J2-8 TaxID=2931394 RepID=UPI001FD228EB|nr:PIG-L family deacetylase [Phaeobacter sp. J2-8]MCJ7874170.1 PIG-L family deacetylase [Phaeobacter sp. J2-8]